MSSIQRMEARIEEINESLREAAFEIRRYKKMMDALYKQRYQLRQRINKANAYYTREDLEWATAVEQGYPARVTYSSYRDNPGWD